MQQPHPLTVAYVKAAIERPGMYMGDFDLRELEAQLHGFDAALGAAGLLDSAQPMNVMLGALVERDGLSGSVGWARALQRRHGLGEPSFNALCSLLVAALPHEFSLAASSRSGIKLAGRSGT